MKKFRLIAVILIISMIFPFTSLAADNETAKEDLNKGLVNHVVNLEGQSKMTVHDVMLFPTNQGNQLVFKADIYNANNNELSFNYYWMRIITKQGTRHNVTMVNNESAVIVPRGEKTFTFTALVGDNVKLSDITVQVIRWNFSVDGYEQHLGNVSISEAYDPTVSWTYGKNLVIDNSPVMIHGERYQAAKAGNNFNLKIDLKAKNNGKFTVNLPNYTYYIQTDDELVYPVTLLTSDVQVLPNSEAIVQLQAKLPDTVDLKKINMVIVEEIGEYKIPQMKISLPEESSVMEEEIREEYEYNTSDGTYTITLSNVQRLPNNETDILSFEVNLANLGSDKPLPTLNLIAELELDGIQIEPAVIEGIKLDNNLSIKKDNKITFIFNTEIPFNFEFDEIRLNLSEKEGETTLPIATFVNEAMDLELETTNVIRTTTTGRESTVYLMNSEIYEGSTSDIIYAAVVMTNEEPRFVPLEQLVAYYKINDSMFFPAEIPDNKLLTMPTGKALIPITTEIPKDFPVNSLELVIGTQLKDTESYKQANILKVPIKEHTVKEDFTDLVFANYKLTMEDMNFYMNGGSGSIRFVYKLTKDVYQHELAEHKVRFTLVVGENRYSQDVILGKDIEVGTGKYQVAISAPDLMIDIPRNGYHIEVLDAYDSGEKLKAVTEKSRSWYSD